jgi:hypothetical protein
MWVLHFLALSLQSLVLQLFTQARSGRVWHVSVLLSWTGDLNLNLKGFARSARLAKAAEDTVRHALMN